MARAIRNIANEIQNCTMNPIHNITTPINLASPLFIGASLSNKKEWR